MSIAYKMWTFWSKRVHRLPRLWYEFLKLIVEKLRLKHIRDGALIRRNDPEAVVLWLREIVNPKKYRLGWQKQVRLIFSENSG